MRDYAQLIFSLATMCAVLGNFWLAWRNTKQIQEVAHQTNSLKDELVSEVRKASFAAGEKSEQNREQDRAK